jgi:DNA-binding NarL/FixJ family response regulator
VVAACGDLDGLLEAIERERPDVVLTDIRMPPMNTEGGIRLAAQLRESHPGIGVVVLSHYADPTYVLSLLEAGSDRRGYLKDRVRDRGQLVSAIDMVARGGSVIDPKIVEVLVAAKGCAERSPLSQLTPREREVLAQIAEGKSNNAIAESLVLTKRAVEKQINSIFLKLEPRALPPRRRCDRVCWPFPLPRARPTSRSRRRCRAPRSAGPRPR